MRYEDEVPRGKQITLNQFRLLPGSRIYRRLEGSLCYGIVREVGSANPEYVLGGSGAKDAGVEIWTEKERDECTAFIGGEHLPVRIRLKKSMWAVIECEVNVAKSDSRYGSWTETGTKRETLYTYDIEELFAKGDLVIVSR